VKVVFNVMSSMFFDDIGGGFGGQLRSRSRGFAIAFAICISTLVPQIDAANWYVRPSASGSNSGTDWNNAWSAASLNSNMSRLSAGDTVWIAGGTYTTGLNFSKSGTPNDYIYFKAVLSTDATATSSPGWQSSFACDVTRVVFNTGGDSC